MFICLAELSAGGGATLVVAGSQRLVESLAAGAETELRHSADVRAELIRRHAWIKSLCSRTSGGDRVAEFMDKSGRSDGVELRVVELTGAAGEVWLMHPLMLHAPSKNCASSPRIVVSSTVYRAGVTAGAEYRAR